MPNCRISSFGKKSSEVEVLTGTQGTQRTLRTVRWDISSVKLKSNWSVGKRLLAFDSKIVWKSRLNGWFGNWFILFFEGAFGWCHVALRELLRHSDGTANRLFCQSDISRSKWSPTEWLVWKVIHFERISFEGASEWCYVAFRELLRHSNVLANQ